MQSGFSQYVQLATFDRVVAAAVELVLGRAGIPARLGDEGGPEVDVLVPEVHRDRALEILAAQMEQINALSREPVSPPEEHDEDHERPLVMDRFRSLGVLALVLAPLLVVTLAVPALPRGLAIAVFLGGMVAVVALRDRR